MSTEIASNHSFELQMAEYTRELKDLLERLPRYLKRDRRDEALRQVSRWCGAPGAAGRDQLDIAWARVSASLHDLKRALDSGAAKDYVRARYDEATRAYEQWLAARRAASRTGETAAVKLGSLRPLIGARTVFHMSSGVVATVMYQFFLTTFQAELVLLTLLAGSWRWRSRAGSRSAGTTSWPASSPRHRPAARVLPGQLLDAVPAGAGAGDARLRPAGGADGAAHPRLRRPAAAWLGRRYGKLKLYRSKSLVGSLAFAGAGTLVAGTYLMLFCPEASVGSRLLAAGLASLVGAVAELFSGPRLDDNLSIPIASTMVAAIVL
jgi:hypothetical protein